MTRHWRRGLRLQALALAFAATLGCGSSDCVQGRTAPCTCPSGAPGTLTCQTTHRWSSCVCATPPRADAGMTVDACVGCAARDAWSPPVPDAFSPTSDASGGAILRESIAQIGPVSYGGGPFCEYQATFTNVAIEARTSATTIDQFTVNMTYNEFAPACPFPALPSNTHTFQLLGVVDEGGGAITVDFTQLTGMPNLGLTFVGSRQGDGTYSGDLIFSRSDSDPMLNFTIGYVVALNR